MVHAALVPSKSSGHDDQGEERVSKEMLQGDDRGVDVVWKLRRTYLHRKGAVVDGPCPCLPLVPDQNGLNAMAMATRGARLDPFGP